MDRTYVVVRANSTSGPFIVERALPGVANWSKAHIAGFSRTKREALALAARANRDERAREPHADPRAPRPPCLGAAAWTRRTEAVMATWIGGAS